MRKSGLLFLLLMCFKFAFTQEKIHIQYDRTNYTTGDTIWFKAYVLLDGKPSFNTRNFYLQLIDLEGNLIMEYNYPIIGATVAGGIPLHDSLTKPFYAIRAFTPVSAYYAEPLIYKKLLQLDPQKGNLLPGDDLKLSVTADGGSFLAGIPTTFIVKATSNGKPVAVNGTVRTVNAKEPDIPFKLNETGTGSFIINGKKEEHYYAEVNWMGKKIQAELSKPDTTGFSFQVKPDGTSFTYRIAAPFQKKITDTFLLTIKHNGQMMIYKELYLDKEANAEAKINLGSTDPGFILFTLEKKNGSVIGSRTLFHLPAHAATNVSLADSLFSFSPRALNEFSLQFPDTLARTYTVSVVPYQTGTKTQQESLLYTLLFAGSLEKDPFGTSYPYASFFTDTANLKTINHLMAFDTHLKQYANPRKAPDQYLQNFSGFVFSANRTKAPMVGGKLSMLLNNDGKQLILESPVSLTGEFFADSLLFFGDARVFYTYYNSKGKQEPVTVQLNIPPSRDSVLRRIPVLKNIYAHMIDTITAIRAKPFIPAAKTTLQDVTVFTKIKKPTIADKYVSDRFKHDGAELFDMTKSRYSGDVLMLIRVKLPHLIIIPDESLGMGEYRLRTKLAYGINSRESSGWDIDIFIDEFRSTLGAVARLNMDDIALIKYHTIGFPVGAVFVYTKKADDRGVKTPTKTSTNFFNITGYAPILSYIPLDYTIIDTTQTLTDRRKTLLWEPDMHSGSSIITRKYNFYNNETATGYLILVEGVDIRGRPFRKEFRIGHPGK